MIRNNNEYVVLVFSELAWLVPNHLSNSFPIVNEVIFHYTFSATVALISSHQINMEMCIRSRENKFLC